MRRAHWIYRLALAGTLALQLVACFSPAPQDGPVYHAQSDTIPPPPSRQPSAREKLEGLIFCWSDSLGSYVATKGECRQEYERVSPAAFRERREANAVAALFKAHPDLASADEARLRDHFDAAGSGTAFFVTDDGYLITNKHVVEGCDLMTLIAPDMLHTAVVIDSDDRDLALLKANVRVDQYALFTTRQLRVGEDVYAIGYPLFGELGGLIVTDGIVSSLAGPPDSPQFIQISTPIQPGNSGGPLVDQYGTIAGVVTAKNSGLAGNIILEGVGFAIRPGLVMGFMLNNGVDPLLFAYKELPTPNIAEYVSTYTFPIVCWIKKKAQP